MISVVSAYEVMIKYPQNQGPLGVLVEFMYKDKANLYKKREEEREKNKDYSTVLIFSGDQDRLNRFFTFPLGGTQLQ